MSQDQQDDLPAVAEQVVAPPMAVLGNPEMLHDGHQEKDVTLQQIRFADALAGVLRPLAFPGPSSVDFMFLVPISILRHPRHIPDGLPRVFSVVGGRTPFFASSARWIRIARRSLLFRG